MLRSIMGFRHMGVQPWDLGCLGGSEGIGLRAGKGLGVRIFKVEECLGTIGGGPGTLGFEGLLWPSEERTHVHVMLVFPDFGCLLLL